MRSAATAAVERTAAELRPDNPEQAEELAMVISQVFGKPLPDRPLAGHATVLEALQTGIAAQLAVLDDVSLTGTGQSSAEVLGVPGTVVAATLTGLLLREIVTRGAGGGSLFPLASQLNDDVTHMQGQRLEGMLGQLAGDVHQALAWLDTSRGVAAPTALAQLPPLTVGFTGRDDELAVLADLLAQEGTAGPVLVSAVAGLAGVGKTTLTVAAGHAAVKQGWFSGGVLFVDLHGYDETPVEAGQALDALLRALGVPSEHIPPITEERAALYRSILAQIGQPVLVIADNASSEAQVRPLLPGTGPHKVLVTSRHTLAGLGARLIDVTIFDEDASVALLDAALRVARPGDGRISGDLAAARRLAGICGGLPLALQITAALLAADRALTAAELAGDLAAESARLEHLAYDDGSGSDAPSVAAAFGLSYRKLDDTVARVFRLLAVNPGPDISTAAAAILAELPVGETRRVLADLARAHLAEPTPGAGGRWRMHDLLRLYALQVSDSYAEADGRDLARDRILDYYLEMADAADSHLRALPGTELRAEFTGRDDALAWLDAERASLVAAVRMAADTGRHPVALHLSIALAEYLDWRRRFDDWLVVTTISLGTAQRLGDRVGEGAVLNNLGLALQRVRRFDEAISACQNAIAIHRETGNRHGEGTALNNLGLALRQVRRFEEAATAHQEDLAICHESGDRRGESLALSNLGSALQEQGRLEEAATAGQHAAAICGEIGDRHGEANALTNLSVALRELYRFQEAITAGQDAAAIYRMTGDRHGEAMALTNLGLALQEAQRSSEAVTAHQDAVALYRDVSDRHGEGTALNNLSITLQHLGRFEEAIPASQDAAAIYRETGDRHSEAIALINLSTALQEASRFDEAVSACQDAAAMFRETGDEHSERVALDILDAAKVARQAGD